MRRDHTRLARRALLALLVVVSGAVAWSLRRPPSPGAGPGEPQASAPPPGTTVGDMAFLRFREGERKVEVKARAMVGREGDAMRLQGVEVTLPFVAQGRAQTATITADECLYQSQPQRATFRGNVKVRTDDGFELDTDSLKYWGDEERVFTRDDARFRRGRTSGSSRGMEYKAGAGLTLNANVKLRIEGETGPPTDVEAASAHGSREERLVTFEGGVLARQGGRELRSERLQLTLTADLDAVERAAAIEDVDLVTSPGAALPGSAAPAAGTRRLRCRRLNVTFRAKGVLQEAIAVNNASLEVEPGPGDPRERRRLEAPQIHFDFDEEGRLVGLQSRPTAPGEEKARRQTVLTAEPLAPGVGEDDRAGGAEADRLRGRERGPEAGGLAEENRAARDGLREEELGGAPLGREGEDADEERRERDEEKDELDERGGGPREVLHAAPARERVARDGDGEREDREDRGEDLRPSRTDREDELLPGAEEERGRGPPRGAGRPAHGAVPEGSGPITSALSSGVAPAAPGSASREAASAQARMPELIGVWTVGLFPKTAVAAGTNVFVRWSETQAVQGAFSVGSFSQSRRHPASSKNFGCAPGAVTCAANRRSLTPIRQNAHCSCFVSSSAGPAGASEQEGRSVAARSAAARSGAAAGRRVVISGLPRARRRGRRGAPRRPSGS